MSSYQPIACGDYDFLEIACMDHYDLQAETKDGTFVGRAENLRIANGEEFLQLDQPGAGLQEVRIDRLLSITVTSSPRRFDSHVFAAAAN